MSGLLKRYILVLLIALMLPSVMSAQKVSASLDTNAIRIGEQITFTYKAEYPAGTVAEFPLLRDSLGGNIEIVAFLGGDTVTKDNITHNTFKYSVTSFDSGTFTLPALPVTFIKPGTPDTTLFTDSLSLKVFTVAVDTTKAIRDIKPIMLAPITFAEILPYLTIAFFILLAIALLVYYLWRRKQNKPFFPVIRKPVLPPWETAMKKFDEIERNKLWQNGKVKEYYSEISDTLRIYIENQFNVNAMEMVTDDILEGLQKTDIRSELINNTGRVLRLADLVKFAKEIPLPDEHAEVLSKAREFVLGTKPAEDATKTKSNENTKVKET